MMCRLKRLRHVQKRVWFRALGLGLGVMNIYVCCADDFIIDIISFWGFVLRIEQLSFLFFFFFYAGHTLYFLQSLLVMLVMLFCQFPLLNIQSQNSFSYHVCYVILLGSAPGRLNAVFTCFNGDCVDRIMFMYIFNATKYLFNITSVLAGIHQTPQYQHSIRLLLSKPSTLR